MLIYFSPLNGGLQPSFYQLGLFNCITLYDLCHKIHGSTVLPRRISKLFHSTYDSFILFHASMLVDEGVCQYTFLWHSSQWFLQNHYYFKLLHIQYPSQGSSGKRRTSPS